MNEIIEKIKPYVVQIASPYATGTGFYVPVYNLVITNEHVIRGCKTIVVQDFTGKRQIGTVVYLDTKHDLSMIRLSNPLTHLNEKLIFSSQSQIGTEVIALGHPYGLSFSSTFGIISNTDLEVEGISYIMHDAALNPGNSGGPLIDKSGEIIGINSSIFKEGKNIGIAIHGAFVEESLKAFINSNFTKGTKCPSCLHLNEDKTDNTNSCTICGMEIELISNLPEYTPIGIAKRVEDIIERLNYKPETCRRGQLSWELVKGSATINVNYHSKSGYLSAESILCNIPSDRVIELYQFLLQSNYNAKGLTFSIKENNIILSLMVYDQHLNEESTYILLEYLLQTSDEYDDVLVNKYKATWCN